MVKTLNTRIKNRLDTLSNWRADGVELLPGEIAIALVTADDDNLEHGIVGGSSKILIKVGEALTDAQGNVTGTKAFNDLPWLSAPAADVYAWAKQDKLENVTIELEGETTSENVRWYANTVQQLNKYISDAGSGNTFSSDVNTLINEALEALACSDTPGKGNLVKAVKQTDGKIEVTYGELEVDELPEIPADKIKVAASDELLPAKLSSIDTEIDGINTEIDNLKTAVAGGVHYRGIVDSPNLSDDNTAQTVTVAGKSYAAADGDVVIQNNKEFIWTNGAWEELGDLSRVGALETQLSDLNVTDTAVSGQFVTTISQTNGKITLSRAQPNASDVKYNSTTVGSELSSHTDRISGVESKLTGINNNVAELVSSSISGAINDLDVADTETSGQFVTQVSQTNGKIAVIRKSLPVANASTPGIVKLDAPGGAATYEYVNEVASDVQELNTNIESNYVRYNSEEAKLYIGAEGDDAEEVVLISAGTASDLI